MWPLSLHTGIFGTKNSTTRENERQQSIGIGILRGFQKGSHCFIKSDTIAFHPHFHTEERDEKRKRKTLLISAHCCFHSHFPPVSSARLFPRLDGIPVTQEDHRWQDTKLLLQVGGPSVTWNGDTRAKLIVNYKIAQPFRDQACFPVLPEWKADDFCTDLHCWCFRQ